MLIMSSCVYYMMFNYLIAYLIKKFKKIDFIDLISNIYNDLFFEIFDIISNKRFKKSNI